MRLFMTVTNNHDVAGVGEPILAVVDMTSQLADRIRQLATAVTELQVYRTETFDDTPEWYSEYDTTDTDIRPTPGMEVRMDCVTLNVSDNEYWWESYLPHTQVGCQTEHFPVGDLPGTSPATPPRRCSSRERALRAALRRLITAGHDLTGAIAGATDQFDKETARLVDAASAAEQLLTKN